MKNIKNIALTAFAVFFLGFMLFLINQISGIYLLASELNPFFGKLVLLLLIAIVTGLCLSPVVILLKLPQPLKRPKNKSELPAYKKALYQRLKKNEHLQRQGAVPKTIENLPAALRVLDEEADRVIKSTAQTIFLTTAISQSGKLDALTVLFTQVKMIWKIAHIYYQRPGIKEMAYLYVNVGSTSFLATQIEEIDLARHLQPVVSAIARSTSSKTVPVIGQAASTVIDALTEGTTNAFLSLRIGILTKRYCNQLTVTDKATMHNSTLKEAGAMLGKIAVSSSSDIVNAVLRALGNVGKDTLKNSWENMKKTGGKVKQTVMEASKRVNPF